MALTEAQKAARAKRAAAKKAENKPKNQAAADAPAANVSDAGVQAPVIDKSKKVAGAAQSTVFVVSKMPRGLYLQLFNFVTQQVPVMGGGTQPRVMPMRLPEKIRIRPAVLGYGLIPAYPMESGWSITSNVPSDFWRKWLEQNSQLDIVVQGLIAGFDTEADARAYARERERQRTGLEPLSQEKDPRIQTSMNANVGDVEIDDETPRPKNAA